MDESKLCMQVGTGFLSRRSYCSKPKGHDPKKDPHVAYNNHVFTGKGEDVMYLGPWDDDPTRDVWDNEEANRLHDEWSNRVL